MAKIHLHGVIPPVITPFTARGDVDYDAHSRNLEKWNGDGVGGYLVLGSNSETIYLNEEEKLRLIEMTAQAAGPRQTVLAGTGMESTRETIRLTNLAAERGAHGALLVTPFYYGDKMNDTALIRHYEQIADQCAIPILIYNVPKFTHLNVSTKVIQVLSQHPNIAGMKDSSGNITQFVQFQAVAAEDFRIMVGTASVWYPALTLGCEAMVSALANCAAKECIEVQRLFSQDRWEEAEFLFRRIVPVNHAVTGTYGIAGLKYACTLLGYSGGFVRSPLLELREEEKMAMREILVQGQLL